MADATAWSPHTLELITIWLKQCLETHRCSSHRPGLTRLPLRLLDIDPDGLFSASETSPASLDLDQYRLENSPNVELVSAQSLSSDASYLTLSHRWDNPPALQLSDETLPDLVPTVLPSLLERPGAQTLRDAIMVSRSLGFRYLWIDALCIKQDDAVERAEEIRFMDQIYTNAAANISATASTSGADGLFVQKILSSVSYRCASAAQEGCNDEPILTAFAERWGDDILCAPLSQRAWVFQERWLSPRIIHFTVSGVFWECFHLEASSCSPTGISNKYIARKSALAFAETPPNGVEPRDDPELQKSVWFALINSYSRCRLTYHTDKLIAFSSLARHFARKHSLAPDTYYAGHWRRHLPMSLSWGTLGIQRTDTLQWRRFGLVRPDVYVAPSWSWASVYGIVSTESVTERPVADLVHVDITTADRADPFSSVVDGALRLCCFVCQVTFDEAAAAIVVEISPQRTVRKTVDNKLPECVDISWDAGLVSMDSDLREEVSRVQSPPLRVPLSGGRQVTTSTGRYCLVPISWVHEEGREVEDADGTVGWNPAVTCTHGLVLHRTGCARGQYVRVGSFVCKDRREPALADSNRLFQRALYGTFAVSQTTSDDYVEAVNGGRYIIEIV